MLLSITPTPASLRRRGCARPGFTLMELIIVISIMIVTAALVAPRWGAAVARQCVDAAARRVAADLSLAQSRARASSKPITVAFNVAGHSYEVVGIKDFDTGKSTYTVTLSAAPYFVSLRSASFNLLPAAEFNAFGIPAAGGQVSVGTRSFFRIITLAPESGETSISDAAGDAPVAIQE
ncbi:hypothetical protein PHYC_02587 [Phycisphaerales bacterium]|nr:hypothetical protein PHYC_02587 [Phycisphaerales bacterium]